MRRVSLAFVGLAAILSTSQPQAASHCQVGETDYFSCQIHGTQKTLSICGSSDATEPSSGDAWLQYRFGRLNHVELAYPQDKLQSLLLFQATNLTPIDDEGIRRDIYNLYFDLGAVNYNVEVRDARQPFFGVVVTVANKSVEYQCAGSFKNWQRLQGALFGALVLSLAK